MIPVLILLFLVILILAIYFWYITIPIGILFFVYLKRDKIRAYFNKKNEQRCFRKFLTCHKKDPKSATLYLIKNSKVSKLELEKILGKDDEALFSIDHLYPKLLKIGLDEESIFKLPKYLILKFENLFINSYNAYSGTASNYDENIKNVVINNCDNCYANYVRYSNINSGTNRSTNNSSQSSHNNRKYYDSSKKTQESSYDYSYDYGENNYYKNNTYSSYSKKKTTKENRIIERLRKFDLTEAQAEIIFGKAWPSKLGVLEWRFFFVVKELEIKLKYDYKNKYRIKLGDLLQKVILIIQKVINENPDLQSRYEANTQSSYDFSGTSNNGRGPFDNFYDEYYQDDWQNPNSEQYTGDSYREQNRDSGGNYDYTEFQNEDILSAYDILGLQLDATLEQIKEKYRELILRYHPDRNKSPNANIKTIEINTAYELIIGSKKFKVKN